MINQRLKANKTNIPLPFHALFFRLDFFTWRIVKPGNSFADSDLPVRSSEPLDRILRWPRLLLDRSENPFGVETSEDESSPDSWRRGEALSLGPFIDPTCAHGWSRCRYISLIDRSCCCRLRGDVACPSLVKKEKKLHLIHSLQAQLPSEAGYAYNGTSCVGR